MSKQVILAFGFGTPFYTQPNQKIGLRAARESFLLGADIFTQKDVHCRVPINNLCIYAEDVRDDGNKGYLSTLDLVKHFAHFAKREAWKKVWIIAAPQHWHRCYRDIKKTLEENGMEMKIILAEGILGKKGWYDKSSTQWWTRSWWQWWLREIPLRLLPWWLYKKIA